MKPLTPQVGDRIIVANYGNPKTGIVVALRDSDTYPVKYAGDQNGEVGLADLSECTVTHRPEYKYITRFIYKPGDLVLNKDGQRCIVGQVSNSINAPYYLMNLEINTGTWEDEEFLTLVHPAGHPEEEKQVAESFEF